MENKSGQDRFDEFVENFIAKQNDFWDNQYPKMKMEEKIKYWVSSISRGMRYQGEAIADPYSEFSKKNYELWLELEPEFDELFKIIAHRLGFDFDMEEYKRRISI